MSASHDIDHLHLMALVGYLPAAQTAGPAQRPGCSGAFSDRKLTQENEAQLLNHLPHLRTRRPA